jgi:hypothetical protein
MRLLISFFAFSLTDDLPDASGPKSLATCQDFKVEKNVDYPGAHYLPFSKNEIFNSS